MNELFAHYEKHKPAIAARLQEFKQPKDDKQLFLELCYCLLAANTSARMATRTMDNVGGIIFTGSEEQIREKLHSLRCRFYNRRAHFIFLARKKDLKKDRTYLADTFKGIGYKEASHFLRNTGEEGYAILDKHVLNALVEFGVIQQIPTMNRKNYLNIEKKMQRWSEAIGIGMDELDFVLWSRKSGEILK